MELILSAISAGGLVGASDQFMCLLIVGVAGRLGWVQLAAPMTFMSSEWFIILVAVFWLLSIAPAYASLLSPGVMNAVNSITNFLSGFLVPLSSALLALASAGIIASMNPELSQFLQSMQIFTADGSIGSTGYVVSAASAAVGTSMTAMKALAKPAISTVSGTAGHLNAPLYTTLENLAAVFLMLLAYWLMQLDPWMLVVLAAALFVILLVLLIYAFYQMWRLKRGISKVLTLTQTHPRAGLAVIVECLIWGLGWFAWKAWARGLVMLLVWVLALAFIVALQPVALGLTALFPPVLIGFWGFVAFIYLTIGLNSARSLLKFLEKEKVI